MKVSIATIKFSDDHILSRLVRYLQEQTGWQVGYTPDPKADIVYWFPYLLKSQQYLDWKGDGLQAAYFSHHDTASADKHRYWQQAAQAVDLRIVTTLKYGHELKEYGATAYAHAGIERDKFTLAANPPTANRNPPRVGVSGFTYGDGRKGEALIAKLFTDFSWLNWAATGRGWQLPKVSALTWAEMPAYYQSLDVYVCASTIEGVPCPPLEALSCGVRVVIPQAVGMLDEIPDTAGVYRFRAGDYADLKRAFSEALADTRAISKQSLRDSVRAWDLKAWAADHVTAFNDLLQPPFAREPLADWRGRAGIYYVAYGRPARECAVRAIASAKKHMPDIPVALVSDEPLNAGEDVFIRQPDSDVGGRGAKIRIYELAPKEWEYVLYVDADTEFTADVSVLFQFLADGWEFVICKNPAQYVTTRNMGRPDNKDEVEQTYEVIGYDDVIQWNGGVFGMRRNPRVERLFKAWYSAWQIHGKRDQQALLRAMHTNPLRLMVLGNEWNTVVHYDDPSITAGILHFPQTARRVKGIVNGRLDSAEAFAQAKMENR